MSMRRRIGATFLGAGLVLTMATAQEVPIPGPAASVPPPPAGLGASSPAAPGGTTIWSLLGINQQQREFRQQAMARTPLGDLRSKIQTPLSKITGGIVPEFPPKIPTKLELEDPGIVGKGAKLRQDRAGAIDRIKAVKELGTADCHYWPEAEDGLIEALRTDRNEWVRLAAAEALSSGCCCTKKTIAALTNAASCSDADGNPAEKSPRVIAAACAALQGCLARVCTNPAVMAAPDYIPPTPPVDQKNTEKKDVGEGGTEPATPKGPGTAPPAGNTVKRPVGKEYYTRVGRLSWNQVIVPAKATLAQGPRIPAELALTSGNDMLTMNEAPNRNARDNSARPANLLDIVLGNPATNTTEPYSVAMSQMPAGPAIPYAVTQVRPTVPQQMPTMPATRQVANTTPVPVPMNQAAPATVTIRPMTAPATPTTVKPSTTVPAAPVTIPAPSTMPSLPVIPASSTTPVTVAATQSPRSVKVCEMLTKVTDAKATEAELDKLVTADFSNNPFLVPCTMKYAAEGTDMTVRLACVRAVGRCKVNSKAVLDGLEKLITDRSVELRVEAALIQNDLKNMK